MQHGGSTGYLLKRFLQIENDLLSERITAIIQPPTPTPATPHLAPTGYGVAFRWYRAAQLCMRCASGPYNRDVKILSTLASYSFRGRWFSLEMLSVYPGFRLKLQGGKDTPFPFRHKKLRHSTYKHYVLLRHDHLQTFRKNRPSAFRLTDAEDEESV